MPDTVRTNAELLTFFADGQGYGQITPQRVRDLIATIDVIRRRCVNVQDAPYFATGDGVTDDTAAITAAHTAAKNVGSILVFPPTTKLGVPATYLSSFTLNPAGFRIEGFGAMYLYSGAGTACQWGDDGDVEGLKFSKSGAVGISIGGAIGKVGVTAHNARASRLEFSGFNDGWVQQLSFYGDFRGVTCKSNIARNFRITNTGISNDYVACKSRGVQLTLVGVQCDDTTSNSSGTRWFGGTVEGAVVQNVDILGADNTLFIGTHIEQNAAVGLVGTVSFTNGSVNVVGVGTSFTTAVKVGQYIKADAHSGTAWMRVQSITDNLNIVLSEAYQGATLGGTAASIVGGNVRVAAAAGAAVNTFLIGIEYGVASGTCPAIYVQNGSNVTVVAGDVNLPTLLGANATRFQALSASFTGGLDDRGGYTKLLGPGDSSQFYFKLAANKVFDLVGGGAQTQFKSTNPVQVPPLLMVATQGGAGTGISQTNTAAKNLRNTAVFGAAAVTVTVVFPTAEADAAYFITLTPGIASGAPAAGSLRASWKNKTAAGFDIVLEVAPGAGASVNVDWHLFR